MPRASSAQRPMNSQSSPPPTPWSVQQSIKALNRPTCADALQLKSLVHTQLHTWTHSTGRWQEEDCVPDAPGLGQGQLGWVCWGTGFRSHVVATPPPPQPQCATLCVYVSKARTSLCEICQAKMVTHYVGPVVIFSVIPIQICGLSRVIF